MTSGDYGLQRDQAASASASAACSRCTPTSARRSRRSTPATSPPPSACAASPPATRSATRSTRSSSSRWTSPSRSSRWPSSRRPRPTRRSSASGLGKLPGRRTRPSASQTDEETGQTIISGMGELHLEIIVDRLKREFGVEANVGKPAGRLQGDDHASRPQAEGKYIRQTGGHGQYGHVQDPHRAARAGRGLRVRERDRRRRDPARVHPADREGHPRGPRRAASWPATRWSTSRSRSTTARFHEVDSSEMAFKIAGSMALQGRGQAAPSPVLLEPIMEVEVVTPEEYMGDVIGDLNAPPRPDRQAWSRAAERRSSTRTVPLSEMFGYATDLRSLTQGRATYTMQLRALRGGARSVPRSIVREEVSGARSAQRPATKETERPWPRRSSSGRSRT